MTEARYHELLGRMLDSRISEADADELRHGLETDQARLRDLREHLTLWGFWSRSNRPTAVPTHSGKICSTSRGT